MPVARWEFWIDVGGTFTDCFARRPDGTLVRHKLLSSGVTKGAAAESSTRQEIFDPARARDPEGVWKGYRLRVLDPQGQPLAEGRVDRFDSKRGTLHLSEPLPIEVRRGQIYELFSSEPS